MFQVDTPTLFPSECCLCGSRANGPYLDLGYSLHDAKRGRLYLCTPHFLEAMRTEKLVPLAELETQVARLGDAIGEIARLEEQAQSDARSVPVLQRKLDENESTIQELRATNAFLERKVAELEVDPAVVERQRQIAEMTKPQSRPRRSQAGTAGKA